jgi:hypothetical protein
MGGFFYIIMVLFNCGVVLKGGFATLESLDIDS